jgi:hypothetical protein
MTMGGASRLLQTARGRGASAEKGADEDDRSEPPRSAMSCCDDESSSGGGWCCPCCAVGDATDAGKDARRDADGERLKRAAPKRMAPPTTAPAKG